MSIWQPIANLDDIPTAYRLTCNAFTIIIRSFPDGAGWAATCHAIDMDAKVLLAIGPVAAKREAVRLVCGEIRRMASEAERVFEQHGRAKSVAQEKEAAG